MSLLPIQYVAKPWGSETIWARTDKYVGKILSILEGARLSLQYHNIKDETIHILSGEIIFTYEENNKLLTRVLSSGTSFHIPPGTKHRMQALKFTRILEASTSELDDVVRMEDDYGRI